MAINISDLPPKYQAQAVKKYMEQQTRRGACALCRCCAGSREGKQVPEHTHHTGDTLRGCPPVRQHERGPPV